MLDVLRHPVLDVPNLDTTPATTCENGPLAADTRPGGPFPSCPAVCHRVRRRSWRSDRYGHIDWAPDCRASRLAGSSPCCSRQAGWPCSYPRSRRAGCRIGPRHLIEALRRGPGVRRRHWDGNQHGAVASGAVPGSGRPGEPRRHAPRVPAVPGQGLDWTRRSRSFTCRGLVMDLSCTCRKPAPVTRRITRLRCPLVVAVSRAPGWLT
jgi:hypothetical protein